MRAKAFAIVALLIGLAPRYVHADRGALTVEVSPVLTWWPSMGPAVGSGSGVNGTTGGALIGVRYALRNDLEFTASGFYERPADFTNTGTTVDTDAGPLTGTLTAQTSRWGLLAGARWVHGFVWRWFVGGELGWAQESSTRIDLINTADPTNPQSFGLGIADASKGSFVISPLAGVEWQIKDHWNVAFVPRLQLMPGGSANFGVLLPVSIGYSWYGL
jgi:hypothetical protein